jgi:hypothetical protein
MGEEPVHRDPRSPGSLALAATALISWALGALVLVWITASPASLGQGIGAGLAALYIAVFVGGAWLLALVTSVWHAVWHRTPALPSIVVIGGMVALALGPALRPLLRRQAAHEAPLPALHEACRRGDAARVRALLAEGAPTDELSATGWGPCAYAVSACAPDVLAALEEAGAALSAGQACWAGDDLVSRAVRCPSPEVLERVLARAEDDAYQRGWALGLAICAERADLTELLLAQGAGGRPALAEAARCGRWRSLERIPGTDADRQAALAVAAEAGQTGSIHALLRAGVDPEASALDGDRPLLAAVRARSVEGARMLLDAGAAVNRRGEGFYSPLGTALENRDQPMIRLLLERGAVLDGRPALPDEVRERGVEAVMRELLEGTDPE